MPLALIMVGDLEVCLDCTVVFAILLSGEEALMFRWAVCFLNMLDCGCPNIRTGAPCLL